MQDKCQRHGDGDGHSPWHRRCDFERHHDCGGFHGYGHQSGATATSTVNGAAGLAPPHLLSKSAVGIVGLLLVESATGFFI